MDLCNTTLYSTGCPKCVILEQKLKAKNVEYKKVNDTDLMLQSGITTVPAMKIDGKIYNFAEAIKWANAYEN